MNRNELKERTYGSLLGLAMGDAAGFPAMYHRTLLLKWGRDLLWEFSKQADEQRVNKFSLPFTLSQPEETLHLCGTDDTEFAAAAALILLSCGDEPTAESLFAGWRTHVVEQGDSIWSGVSERASIDNARKGLHPPATGNDNPHHFDDGAVARAVPVGLRFRGDPDKAADVAGTLASITNAEDGIYAAQAMAASIAAAVSGASPADAVAAGRRYIPADSWLGRKTALALAILEEAGSGFAAVPEWNNRVVNGIYNYGNVAPETLAVAYAVFLAVDGKIQEGIQLACLMPKQADSMPAMVGALCGAHTGLSEVPSSWMSSLDTLKGVCMPQLKGQSLRVLAERLAAERGT